jgi:uncharacterized RDD family membrane protein YckC
MDCPVDGDAAVQIPETCFESGAPEESGAAKVASLQLGDDYWRREVATRLERYRARRKPRAPRYPSLRLPFDSAETWLPASGSALAVSAPVSSESLMAERVSQKDALQLVELHTARSEEPQSYANVIEFPRSAAVPVYHANELAEPVFERPRIVEAPEVLPPPPALGGILLEPDGTREPERRGAAVLAQSSAPISRRMLAGLIDALILVGALSGFGGMFIWLNPQRPPLPIAGLALAIVSVVLWASYEFLFTVYTGSTPGLRLARLHLVRFDGSRLPRNLRRWRVLASYVSAFSLGLGYLWSVLDEESLCWHDRITHTHLS